MVESSQGETRTMVAPHLGSETASNACCSTRSITPLRAPRADAQRGVDREVAKQRRIALGPLLSRRAAQGFAGARASAPQQLTSGSCLNAASTARVVSSARPAKTEQRRAVGPRPTGEEGALLFGDFLLGKQEKVTALSGAPPDAASRSDKTPNATAAQGFDTSARTGRGTPPSRIPAYARTPSQSRGLRRPRATLSSNSSSNSRSAADNTCSGSFSIVAAIFSARCTIC
jgi:hypothetical protein